MSEKFKHQGAASADITYFRVAHCIYSGNEKLYDLEGKYWNERRQQTLNLRFMRDECACRSCTEEREHRKRVKAALEHEHDSDGLRAMGWI